MAQILSRLDILGRFPANFHKTDKILQLPVCFPAHKSPSEKEPTLKRKEFACRGSKFFPFRKDPFSEGWLNLFSLPVRKFRYGYSSHHGVRVG